MSLLKSHINVWHDLIISLYALISCLFDNKILILLFMTNFQYGHFMHVGSNNVSVMGRHIK